MDETCSFEAEVTEQDILTFAQLSGDYNPLHTDLEYARTTEFGRPISHGAFLVGLVSRVLGMFIPGTRSLILSMKVKFPKPLFYPARVRVTGRLQYFNPERNTGSVQVTILDNSKLWPVLEAEVSFALHQLSSPGLSSTGLSRTEAVVPAAPFANPSLSQEGPRRILVTGGTGGIGSELLPALLAQYQVCCLTRKPPQKGKEGVEYHQVDLDEEGSLESYLEQSKPKEFYGVLHLSVPPVPRAFISDDLSAVKQHLRHAVEIPLALTKWARQTGSSIKRIVLLGSTYGSKYPKPNLGAYSLGKGAMELLSRLLTSDLSAQGATINVVVPTVIPVGLNEGMSERARKTLIGRMPTGRIVESTDIANVILFLLSDGAAQINGASIVVDGGVAE